MSPITTGLPRGAPPPDGDGQSLPAHVEKPGSLDARASAGDAALDAAPALRPIMSPDVRMLLSDEAVERICAVLCSGSAVCTVCETAIIAGREPRPSVLALRGPDGTAQIRLAHERCAESRLIELDHQPVASRSRPDADSQPERRPTAWALAARDRRVPTVILVCDVAHLEHLDVRGRTLLDAVRLDGLCGGGCLQTLQPPRYREIALAREGSVLWLVIEFGNEPLELASPQLALALLQVAAHQRELLLVLGVGLGLTGANLGRTEGLLLDDEAVAARVRFEDAELVARPLRGARRRVIGLRRRRRRWTAPRALTG